MSELIISFNIDFETPLNWKVTHAQDGIAVATCDEIDLVFQIDAGSQEEQVTRIMKAFRLLCIDLDESGELEKFFEHHGVKVKIQRSVVKPNRRQRPKHQKSQPTFEMSLETLDVSPISSKAYV